MASDVEHPFICLRALCVILLGEVSVQVLCPFFNWIVCLPGVELYEFLVYFEDQIFVLGIISKNVFPYSWFPFHFADVFMQKLFNLMQSHLFILSFISLAIGDISVKILLHGISENLLPVFSSTTLMVSLLKSFIHFVFILVYGVSWWSSFIFLHVAIQISQHHLLKMLFLLHFKFLPPLSNIN